MESMFQQQKNKSMMLKFIFDRFVSFFGILFLLPLLLVLALLIKIKMPDGPVLFTQKRVGRNGELFNIHKFRSMTVLHSGSSVSVAGESRITHLGATLRKYKLDELPELWNVLIGDMSFVGPRPDVPGYADQLKGNDRRILTLRPGITGPASLKYHDEEEKIADFINKVKNENTIVKEGLSKEASDEEIAIWYNDNVIYPDKVRINLYYLDHYSFMKDIQIIFCTILGKKYNSKLL